MKTYGYARTSTQRQDPQSQVDNILKEYPDAVIFSEKYTGTSLNRPEFNKMQKQIQSDIKNGEQVLIVFNEVSRMSREAEEGFKLYQEWYNQGIELKFLKDPHVNTSVFRQASGRSIPETGDKIDFIIQGINRFLFVVAEEQIQIAFRKAEEEVKRLHERTSDGMRAAGAMNRKDKDGNVIKHGSIAQSKIGRHPQHKKSAEAAKVIYKHSKDFGGSLTDLELMKMTNLSRNTYYKVKRQLKQNIT